jgi:hypothetical protein
MRISYLFATFLGDTEIVPMHRLSGLYFTCPRSISKHAEIQMHESPIIKVKAIPVTDLGGL